MTKAREPNEPERRILALERENRLLKEGVRQGTRMRQLWTRAMDDLRATKADLEQRNAQLRRTMAQLEQAQKVLVRQEKLASIGTLSAGVAHEILNPLNIISANVQVLQLEEALPPPVSAVLDEVMRQIHRATKITNNLRIFSHQKRADIVPVDLHALIDETLMLLEHDLNLDGIEVAREYAPGLPQVAADPDLLAQVFLNLLTNARDALGEEGARRITVRTASEGARVLLAFADNGAGIPEGQVGRIFDPFFTTKDPDKGTGLGLSITHSIIEDHGGSISVHSRLGEGTEFLITLPLPPSGSDESQSGPPPDEA